MRAFALLAIVYGATIGVTSALVDADEMISGCIADGCNDPRDSICYPPTCCCENTLDGSTSANSSWSCEGGECCITYYFEEPQDIVTMRIAFSKQDARTRMLDVYVNGDYYSQITSSGGSTLIYETFYLNTDETEEIKLCLDGNDDQWFSITEVNFMVN